jgi:hypothetical protein
MHIDNFVFDTIIHDMQSGYRVQGGEIADSPEDDEEGEEVTGWAEDIMWED